MGKGIGMSHFTAQEDEEDEDPRHYINRDPRAVPYHLALCQVLGEDKDGSSEEEKDRKSLVKAACRSHGKFYLLVAVGSFPGCHGNTRDAKGREHLGTIFAGIWG